MTEGFLKTTKASEPRPAQAMKARRSAKRTLRALKDEDIVVSRQGSGAGGKKPDVD